MVMVRVFSDLHNEFYSDNQIGFLPPELETDKDTVLILAGDIDVNLRYAKSFADLHKRFLRGENETIEERKAFMEKCYLELLYERFKHVIMVLGNHDHYHGNIDLTKDRIKARLYDFDIDDKISILENESVEIDGVLFVGATLWSDFNNDEYVTKLKCKDVMNDFRQIRYGEDYKRIHPDYLLAIHKQSREYIERTASENKDKTVVVVTHHAPSYKSVNERFQAQTLVNGAYASDLSEVMLDNENIKYWFHGHMHDNCDYMIGETNVICNPHGYVDWELNPDFDPNNLRVFV
jgi:Icc-related predicted phosphoesterase